jgi:hypothetical protein
LPAQLRVTLENLPSKRATSEKPFSHFISAEAVASTASRAGVAPFVTKLAPGKSWNVASNQPSLRRERLMSQYKEYTHQKF